jgi:putative SOS response-associated peptidase YedK
MRWGLIPYWSRDPKKEPLRINARVESLTERPGFRELTRRPSSRTRRSLPPERCRRRG